MNPILVHIRKRFTNNETLCGKEASTMTGHPKKLPMGFQYCNECMVIYESTATMDALTSDKPPSIPPKKVKTLSGVPTVKVARPEVGPILPGRPTVRVPTLADRAVQLHPSEAAKPPPSQATDSPGFYISKPFGGDDVQVTTRVKARRGVPNE